jgi:DNA-binding MarR family transcriptional regulator
MNEMNKSEPLRPPEGLQLEEMTMRLLAAVSELHSWEIQNCPYLRTVSGRQLYFGMIRQCLQTKNGNHSLTIDTLKELYYGDGLSITERGARIKLREFEADGIVQSSKSAEDRRSKRITPTQKLLHQMTAHSEAALKILNKHLIVVKR